LSFISKIIFHFFSLSRAPNEKTPPAISAVGHFTRIAPRKVKYESVIFMMQRYGAKTASATIFDERVEVFDK